MPSINASKKINVVTLYDRKPLSFNQTLGALARLLMEAPLQELAQTLAEISGILNEKALEDAECYLRRQFCSEQTIKAICPQDDDETSHFLFLPNTFYILNTLLTFNIKFSAQESFIKIFHVTGGDVSFAGSQPTKLPIAEIFLLTNQLLLYLEMDLEGVAFDYSRHRVQGDVFTALSKAKNLYDVPYFNEQFIRHFGYTISQWAVYQFMLLTAVKVRKPAKIELGFSFNKIKDDADRERVENLLGRLTVEAKSKEATLQEVAQVLQDDFILDNQCRSTPFLKVDQRYICIRQDLLVDSIDNFPYYALSSILTETERGFLFKEFGAAFEKRYIPMISQQIFGQRIDFYTYTRKPHRGGKPGDLYISVTDQAKWILEIKSSRASDPVKKGDKQALIDKYIHPKSTSGKSKGIIQAWKDAAKVRNEGFSGEIFTGIVFYNLPFNAEFDQLIAQELEPTQEYREYQKNSLNHPSIWLDILAYELLLVATQQGVNLYDILKKLSAVPPSEVRREIVAIMRKIGLSISLSSFYGEEVKTLQECCKALLLPESKATA